MEYIISPFFTHYFHALDYYSDAFLERKKNGTYDSHKLVLFEYMLFLQNYYKHSTKDGFFYQSIREITNQLGIDSRSIVRYLTEFENMGFLQRDKRQNPYNGIGEIYYYRVDFKKLASEEVLSQIYRKDVDSDKPSTKIRPTGVYLYEVFRDEFLHMAGDGETFRSTLNAESINKIELEVYQAMCNNYQRATRDFNDGKIVPNAGTEYYSFKEIGQKANPKNTPRLHKLISIAYRSYDDAESIGLAFYNWYRNVLIGIEQDPPKDKVNIFEHFLRLDKENNTQSVLDGNINYIMNSYGVVKRGDDGDFDLDKYLNGCIPLGFNIEPEQEKWFRELLRGLRDECGFNVKYRGKVFKLYNRYIESFRDFGVNGGEELINSPDWSVYAKYFISEEW